MAQAACAASFGASTLVNELRVAKNRDRQEFLPVRVTSLHRVSAAGALTAWDGVVADNFTVPAASFDPLTGAPPKRTPVS